MSNISLLFYARISMTTWSALWANIHRPQYLRDGLDSVPFQARQGIPEGHSSKDQSESGALRQLI